MDFDWGTRGSSNCIKESLFYEFISRTDWLRTFNQEFSPYISGASPHADHSAEDFKASRHSPSPFKVDTPLDSDTRHIFKSQ